MMNRSWQMTTKRKKGIVLIGAVLVVAFLVGYFLGTSEPGRTGEDTVTTADTGAEQEHVQEKDTAHAHEKEAADDAGEGEKEQIWTCPMHPQIRLSDPGDCPICGMELVPASEGGGGSSEAPVLRMSPAGRELAEIETSAVQRRYVTKDIRMAGKVQYDEQRVSTISAWVPGRLDKLYVDFTGATVNKGDHMVYMYSPEVRTAEKELLQAIDTVQDLKDSSSETMLETARATVKAVREKLRLWGLSNKQIREIEKRDKPSDHITINAPRNGIVIEKNANEGDYVKTGTDIYKVADLSRVWIMLDAYESDLQWLKYGQPVEFEVEAYPGRTFKGRISFIEPFLTEKTRTVKVRVNAENPDRLLKPGMFVHAEVKAKTAAGGLVMEPALEDKWICPMHPGVLKDHAGACDICGMDLVTTESQGYVSTERESEKPLVIPETAPLLTGKRAVVYVAVPDTKNPTYEGRVVELGPHAGDFYLVESGLKEGERVVTHGSFKIDSALQIKAKRSMMSISKEKETAAQEQKKFQKIPADFQKQLFEVLESYFALQRALTDDKKDQASKAAQEMRKKLEAVDMTLVEGEAHHTWMELSRKLKKPLTPIQNAEKLAAQREQFRILSESVLKVVRRFGVPEGETVYRFWCPMAFDEGAVWLGAEKKVRNPYMGAKMPQCGSVEETFGKE